MSGHAGTTPTTKGLVLSAAIALVAVVVIVAALVALPPTEGDAMPDPDTVTPILDIGPLGSRGNPIDTSLINPVRPNTR